MSVDEVIVCSKCGRHDCRVDELREKKLVSMDEYANKHQFPEDLYTKYLGARTKRNFVITCQDCGYQKEFSERIVDHGERWTGAAKAG